MPYKAKGKCVYKKKRDGSLGEKVGCTDGPVKDYLAALYANTDENLEKRLESGSKRFVRMEYMIWGLYGVAITSGIFGAIV